jgi:hypothetical protein
MAVEDAHGAATAPVTPPDAPDATPAPDTPTDDVAALRREASSYRRQLRTAEAERDGLRAQLDHRDRADAERLAATSMAAGGDLWVGGVELAALRDDAGALSPELVERAVEGVLAERPHWRKTTGGFDGGARASAPAPGPSFGEALKNAGGS